MWMLLFTFCLSFQTVFAGLDRMILENLNANYEKPYGRGEIDKVNIGFSAQNLAPYQVEIFRKEKTFEIKSTFVDMIWNDPWSIVHDVENFSVTKANASFGKKDHSVDSERVTVAPPGLGTFELETIKLSCQGTSTDEKLENRLMDDCRKKLELTVSKLEIPIDFFMSQIVADYPQEPLSLKDRPADNFNLTVNEGDFSFLVYTRVVFYAGLRAWGNISYENNRKTIIIRIDQIKFGYVSITPIVMRELARRIKHPNVIVSGNYIIINL
jgi:hypothetical protein